MDLSSYVEFAAELAEASGAIIRPYFGMSDLRVDLKSDQTPVTAADREGERVMREMIMGRFPDHGIVGEEFGGHRPDAEFVWYLDPVDGTKSFTAELPLFGTLIGLVCRGEPIVGVIHQPVLNQLCLGTAAKTTLNGRPVRVRRTADLSEAVLLATSLRAIRAHKNPEKFEQLFAKVKLFRTWGDCYGYLMVACGGADIMLDPIMNPWDLLPLIPVIRGAGGVITDWEGGAAARGNSCVAAGPELHKAVIGILNNAQLYNA